MFAEEKMVSPILSQKSKDIALNVTIMDIRHMNVDQRIVTYNLHLNLKDIVTIVRSMGIENKNANLMKKLIGHSRSKEMLLKVTYSIGITILATIFICVVNMVML